MVNEQINLPPFLDEIRARLVQARTNGDLLVQSGDEGFARAPSNIALLKYWGKATGVGDQIPVGPSLSRALDAFHSTTKARALTRMRADIHKSLPFVEVHDEFELRDSSGTLLSNLMPPKMQKFVRKFFSGWADEVSVRIESINNFPTGCGVASSASGYAALVGALADLAGIREFMNAHEYQKWLVEWARLGSGSATRSAIVDAAPGQFVAWELDPSGCTTQTIAKDAHESLKNFRHLLAVFSTDPKSVSSSEGHLRAHLSPFQGIRVAGLKSRYKLLCESLQNGDFETIRQITEEDALLMHAVMATGQPPVVYMSEHCAKLIEKFVHLRDDLGMQALWTLDAGPNVHFLVHVKDQAALQSWLVEQSGVSLVLSGDEFDSSRDIDNRETVRGFGLVLGQSVRAAERERQA